MKRLLIAGLLIAGICAAASAQQPPQQPATVHVRGKIASLDGNVLTVAAPIGPATVQVTLTPNFRVSYVVATTFAAIVAGSYIGTAAVPQSDGTFRAIEVTVFPPGLTPNPGSRPYDLTPTSTMTNGTVATIASAKVDNAAANVLTVTYEGGETRVVVTPGTPIVTSAPADASALVPGARVSITATKNADGTLSAASVQVGKDGLIPPT